MVKTKLIKTKGIVVVLNFYKRIRKEIVKSQGGTCIKTSY